jgi:Ca2+-binding RTX toxin-like protein
VDTITDFNPTEDSIALSKTIFPELHGRWHQLIDSDAFAVGTEAVNASDRIIYNPTTGALTYDDDGVGEHAALQIATLGVNLALTATNFLLV